MLVRIPNEVLRLVFSDARRMCTGIDVMPFSTVGV